MKVPEWLFVIFFFFVGAMLVNAFWPRKKKMPPAGNLVEHLSPQLRSFAASLPRSAGDALAELCQPSDGGTDSPSGYTKFLLPLWQTSSGEQWYLRQWDKLGAQIVFHGEGETANEQAFLSRLVLRVLQQHSASDRPRALAQAQHAATDLGFRYLNEALSFMTVLRPRDDDYDDEEQQELARDDFAKQIEQLEKKRK